MWDVVMLLVVVIFMASYWLVSSLRQRGLFRTLLGMVKGVVVVVTFGYFCASKALDLHNQTVVSTDANDDGPITDNMYWEFKDSPNPNECSIWQQQESIRRGNHGW